MRHIRRLWILTDGPREDNIRGFYVVARHQITDLIAGVLLLIVAAGRLKRVN